MLYVCYIDVTRAVQGCQLQGCFKDVSRVFQGCHTCVMRFFQGCFIDVGIGEAWVCKSFTKECSNGVARVLLGFEKVVTQVFQ